MNIMQAKATDIDTVAQNTQLFSNLIIKEKHIPVYNKLKQSLKFSTGGILSLKQLYK